MLDLEKLARPREAIVPILNGTFVFEKKHYRVRCEDGWQKVEIAGNRAHALEPAVLAEYTFPHVLGYTHNNALVFQNFDVAKRKWKFGLSAPLHFNQSQTFEAVKAVVWEDRRVYWAEPNYSDVKALELKDLLERDQTLDGQKGLTPELRTVFLFHAIERSAMQKVLEKAKQREDHERQMRDIPYRLRVTFQRAGAEVVSHSLSGNRIVVDWKIPGSDTEYNSVIDVRTWMVAEAGYCMSNDDKRHNITSLVKTAEEYEERGVTFITRN
jgi:hypothetical protein